MDIKVKYKDLEDLLDSLEQFSERDFKQRIDDDMRNYAEIVKAESQDNLVDNDLVDTGFLLNSAIIENLNNLKYNVTYTADYAVYVHELRNKFLENAFENNDLVALLSEDLRKYIKGKF